MDPFDPFEKFKNYLILLETFFSRQRELCTHTQVKSTPLKKATSPYRVDSFFKKTGEKTVEVQNVFLFEKKEFFLL